MKTIQVGLLGFGTVGTGVVRLLSENQDVLDARVGAAIRLKAVADIDIQSDRGIKLDKSLLTTRAESVIEDPAIDIIIEMIGGETIAKELILRAIAKGKPVVTANKALLAKHGNSLFKMAQEHGVDLAYEASIGGCMPIVKTIREALVGNRIATISGILNGTCNYILSKITDEGITFAEALSQAKTNGYAEADPTLDVDGYDTAHKLALLAAMGYGMQINFDDIYIEGISKITPLDIAFAEQFGYRIKLLAISKYSKDAVEARVHPTMIPFDNLLSNVNGTLNAVTVSGDAVGDILLYGHGAGMMPTASSVISDVVDIARNLLAKASGRIPLLGYKMDHVEKLSIRPVEEIVTHYYFRFLAMDRPGVLSKIAGILGDHDISLRSVHQKGRKTDGAVPVVMLSHVARESHVQAAMSSISALDVVSGDPMVIRIEDDMDENGV